jgi:hypothetical protein
MGLTENLPQAKYGKNLPKATNGITYKMNNQSLVDEINSKPMDTPYSIDPFNLEMKSASPIVNPTSIEKVDYAGPEWKDLNNKGSHTGRKTTPGDMTQMIGAGVAPLANFAASFGIAKDKTTMRKETFLPREQRISSADTERAIRQEGAALRAAGSMSGKAGEQMKRSGLAGVTKAISENRLQTDRVNTELAMAADAARLQQQKTNIATDVRNQEDARTRRDLARTARLTAAEQVGTGIEKIGKTQNQGLTNEVQLKTLKEAFPNFDINSKNMSEFIKAVKSGDTKLY